MKYENIRKRKSHETYKARAKVKISIGEVKEHKSIQNKNINYRNAQQTQAPAHIKTNTTSSEELSPTNFLSVSKLKSSIQNIFS